MSYYKVLWNLEATRLVVLIVPLAWNLTDTSAAVLLRSLPNFRVTWQYQIQISWLWDFHDFTIRCLIGYYDRTLGFTLGGFKLLSHQKTFAKMEYTTSDYLSQCWPRFISAYCITRPQCVNSQEMCSSWFNEWVVSTDLANGSWCSSLDPIYMLDQYLKGSATQHHLENHCCRQTSNNTSTIIILIMICKYKSRKTICNQPAHMLGGQGTNPSIDMILTSVWTRQNFQAGALGDFSDQVSSAAQAFAL